MYIVPVSIVIAVPAVGLAARAGNLQVLCPWGDEGAHTPATGDDKFDEQQYVRTRFGVSLCLGDILLRARLQFSCVRLRQCCCHETAVAIAGAIAGSDIGGPRAVEDTSMPSLIASSSSSPLSM